LSQAETARQAVRDKYALMQQDIDAAGSTTDLQAILGGLEIN
jgi:hypothetical protein